MVTLNSLNTIIDDILLELRNNNISESENISRIQIEQWITQYRAMLIKQDVDKGRDINPGYIQVIRDVPLIANYAGGVFAPSNAILHVADLVLPKSIDFHFKSGILNVTDTFGNEIQQTTQVRARFQSNRKWTSADYVAYVVGNRMHIEGPGELEYINIYMIAENPRDISSCVDPDSPYPIPINMIPTLKELIFTKELKVNAPTDRTNNSNPEMENIQVEKRAQ